MWDVTKNHNGSQNECAGGALQAPGAGHDAVGRLTRAASRCSATGGAAALAPRGTTTCLERVVRWMSLAH